MRYYYSHFTEEEAEPLGDMVIVRVNQVASGRIKPMQILGSGCRECVLGEGARRGEEESRNQDGKRLSATIAQDFKYPKSFYLLQENHFFTSVYFLFRGLFMHYNISCGDGGRKGNETQVRPFYYFRDTDAN